jgi:hypothetical protein
MPDTPESMPDTDDRESRVREQITLSSAARRTFSAAAQIPTGTNR